MKLNVISEASRKSSFIEAFKSFESKLIDLRTCSCVYALKFTGMRCIQASILPHLRLGETPTLDENYLSLLEFSLLLFEDITEAENLL